MEIARLKYFVSVARHLSFTRAAEECYVSQAVISRQIACLEEDLGVHLFYRNNRQVELTTAGKYLFDEAVVLIQNYNTTIDRVQKISFGYEGALRIGIGPYEPELIKAAYCNFVNQYPGVNTTVYQFTYHILAFRFTRELLDVVICSKFHAQKFGPYEWESLSDPQWSVIAHRDHPFWSLPPGQRKRLVGQTLVVMEDDFFDDLKNQCLQSGLEVENFVQTNFLTTMTMMLEAQVGISVLPAYLTHTLPNTLQSEPVDSFPAISPFICIYRKHNHNPCIPLFLEALRFGNCGRSEVAKVVPAPTEVRPEPSLQDV